MATEQQRLDHAREMRRNPTEWEKRLWRLLSNSQLGGFKFRRQAVIAPYICDFLCPARSLIVELDGDTHEPAADAQRDAALTSRGYRTLRFTNSALATNPGGVLDTILAALREQPDRWSGRPHPAPEGEGPENIAC